MTSIPENSKRGNWRHGMRHTPTYTSYRSMLQRAHSRTIGQQSETYTNVDKRWIGRNGFINFLKDMGVRPSIDHTLDRINNKGNYEPANCRWATKHEQAVNRNMFKNNTTGHTGVYWDKSSNKWIAQIRVNRRMHTLGRFLDINDAVKVRKQAEINFGYNKP